MWPGLGWGEGNDWAPSWDSGDTPNQRNLFSAVLNLEISLGTDSGTPSNWKTGVLSVNIFQSLSKASMGGWQARKLKC